MTHRLCALLHLLASELEPINLYGHPLSDQLPEAIERKLARNPDDSGSGALASYWAELTDKGREAVAEGLCAMNEVA